MIDKKYLFNKLKTISSKSITVLMIASILVYNSSAMMSLPSLPRSFNALPNKYDYDTNPFYDSEIDRYPNVYSIKQNESKKHERQTNPYHYTTKCGGILNASKVIRVNESLSGKFSIIATQAPIKENFDDFLDLLCTSSKVDGVVVLGPTQNYWTRERGEIPAYFSDEFLHEYRGKFGTTSSYRFEKPKLDVLYTGIGKKYIMNITSCCGINKTKPVYHFPNWIDHDVPNNTEDFIKFVEQFKKNRKLVVHCSAGIGRTGIFAAYLYALRTGETDPYEIVYSMRQYRKGMVQNAEQFNFLCYLCQKLEGTSLSSNDFVKSIDYTRHFQNR